MSDDATPAKVRLTDGLGPLVACPFCGSAPGTLARPDNIDGTEFYAAVFCHCEGYSATAHAGRRGKTQDEATSAAHAAWNRRAAIAAPPGWQPIETAPKDGRKIIVAYVNRNGKLRTVMACWLTDERAAEMDTDGVGLEGGWYECIDNWDDYTEVAIHEGEPANWMPILAAPDATTTQSHPQR